MFEKRISVTEQIRLQEELQEMVAEYGFENILTSFERLKQEYAANQNLMHTQKNEELTTQIEAKNQSVQQEAIALQEKERIEQANKVKLPPNAKNLESFIAGFNEVVASGQINAKIIDISNGFVESAKKILSDDLNDKNFIMSLTQNVFIDWKFQNPYEDWIDYNIEKIRTFLKRALRLKGYQFLDSEVEVGNKFDPKKHNCVRREYVPNQTMDGRVIKVLSEGVIIGRILHINCNVVVGQYSPQQY